MWDLIHDRTHMRGDLPFDPFMIKQRMPFFLYSLEELRCDLTAFREAVAIDRRISALPEATQDDLALARHARLRAVLRDLRPHLPLRHHRQPGAQLRRPGRPAAVRLAAPAPRAALDRHPTDLRLGSGPRLRHRSRCRRSSSCTGARSTDPKIAHWLAAYALVSGTVEPHPASAWKAGDLPLTGLPRELTDAVMDDEFPLSMFYEAFEKKMRDVVASTSGITGTDA